jgi:amino acid adenylation domain-containing protein
MTISLETFDRQHIRCLHRLFESQAEAQPRSIAVCCNRERITYGELNRRANQLAHYLRSKGVARESLVGIHVERSIEMIIGLLGILKAGGAYVPLDPAYPRDRLLAIARDAKVDVLLTEAGLLSDLSLPGVVTVCQDRDNESISQESVENPDLDVAGENLAYVIYTSGSTGKPKGVQINHESVLHLFEAARPLLHFDEHDVWTAFHSYAFDLSVWEIWGCLLYGGRLVVVPRDVIKAPGEFHALLSRERVTVLNQTPSALRQFIYARQRMEKAGTANTSLRVVVCGGEALPADIARDMLAWAIPLWNFYGPTEATVWATAMLVEAADCEKGSVPIGRPLAGVEVQVLDKNSEPLPLGARGELHIGGVCLARGYLNQPELNKARFIRNPLTEDPRARLYKTGDWVRRRADGVIEFIGRMDNQVKINGFRVELGEIESAMREHPGVQQAVVMLREDGERSRRLVAYLVGSPASLSSREMRNFLCEKLPDYMLPSALVWLDRMPLSANGKIDRKALPPPDPARPRMESPLVSPSSLLQLQLTHIWEKLLGVQPIGIHDNFFSLGGHSLLGVRLFVEIQKTCGKNLPLATLVQSPTIAQLATILQEEGWSPSWSSLIAIQKQGSRPPFFCVHAAGGNVLNYFDLARALGPDRPFYALQAQGLDGNREPYTRVEDMAAHYLEEVRALQPKGPYFFGGLSFGGIVAFEMAQQLRAQGEVVALLVLLDATAGPDHLKPLIKKIPGRLRVLMRLRPRAALSYLGQQIRAACKRVRSNQVAPADAGIPWALRDIRRINDEAHRKYIARAYPGRAILFRARESPWSDDLGWRKLITGTLEICEVPGGHSNFINEPHVRFLADKLTEALLKSDRETSDLVDAGERIAKDKAVKRGVDLLLRLLIGSVSELTNL